jgi:exopolysaccharide production protein ExoQ
MIRQGNIPRPCTLPLEDLACAALFAFFAMQGSIPGIAPAQALEMTASAPSSLNTVGGIAAQAFANTLILALILRRPRMLLRQVSGLPWLLLPALLALLAVASCAWSLDPLLTLRRSLPFALAGLLGLWFSARFPVPRQLAILRMTLVALALGTIALVLVDPAIGLDHSSGHAADWQGFFTQKNACGRIMVLGTAVILFGERLTASRFGALLLFLFVLVMSGSRAAWLIEASLVFLWVALAIARRVGPRLRTLLAIAAPVKIVSIAFVLLLGVHRLIPLLGRDPTLSGRAAIGLQVSRFIAQRPLLGYGYDAFWRGMQGPSFQIAASLHFIVAHAHNGFLEIALELGFAGLLLFAVSWIRAWGALWPHWRRGQIDPITWPLAFLLLIVLYDLDENTLLIYNGIFWVLYVAVLANIERSTSDLHHNATAAAHEILTATPYAGGGAFARTGPQAAL